MKNLIMAALCIAMAGCASTPGSVMEKVQYDFGLGEKPEGYVTGADRVMQALPKVAESEMKRLNTAQRHGSVKFQEEGTLRGQYYKEAKVYERYFVLDARATPRGSQDEIAFNGYVDYAYRIYESERKNTRSEAEAASANISTDVTGRDSFTYDFSGGGVWNGRPGEPAKN